MALDISPLRRNTTEDRRVDRHAGPEVGFSPAVVDPTAVVVGSGAIAAGYLQRLQDVLPLVSAEALAQMIALLLEARRTGHRVYVMGNGGSATTASHFVCDLAKTAQVRGLAPLRAFALTDNTPLVTAWANDASYDRIFAEQITALVEPDDVVIAITASGKSPNVAEGLRAAAAKGARTIGLLGFDGGICRSLVDVVVHVPCNHYGLVEDTHSAITHAVTAAVRQAAELGTAA